jgi:hypothetical protein
MLFTDKKLVSTLFWEFGLLPSSGNGCHYIEQFYYPVFPLFWQIETQDYEAYTVPQMQIRLCPV